jgi:RNase H-like domain found in reverse transcriptase
VSIVIGKLQSYLRLLNFYNKFLPNLQSEIKPLHRLLEKGIPWEWSKDCTRAFQHSKELLLSNQVLVPYDPNKSMIVSCDAYNCGVGAVLSHIIDGQEKPVVFASSTFNKAEQGYAQVEKEAPGIIFGVKWFHNDIFGHKFLLMTDHQPLQSILGSKNGILTLAAARLQRWSIILSAYHFNIQNRKAKELANADALSRVPLPEKTHDSQDDLSPVNQVCEDSVFYSDFPCTARE